MEQVIVEVQRTAGCGFAFRQISKKVLQAAQQNGSNVSTRTGGTVVHPESVASITRQTIPSSIPKASPAEWEACTMDQLERVACALRPTGNRRDGHPLALKSLMQMTKTAQCRQVCAQQVLYKNGELQSTIVSLIQTGRLCSAEREDSEERNGPGKDYFELMHRYALCVLANCLQCWSESQGPMSVNADNVSILSNDSTVLALVQDITAVATKPHDAAVACRCLLYLCRHSTRVKQGLRARFDAVVHLDAARQSLHAIVEEPARLLLQALQD